MAYKSSETREPLVESLKGTTFTIPDLEAMVAHWPASVNLYKDLLMDEVHERFKGYVTIEIKLVWLLRHIDCFHQANDCRR
jgi:hypothetical protein